MADSPAKKCDRVLSYTVYSEGSAVGAEYRLVKATVRLSVNRIGKATLQFDAGDMPSRTFPETDADTFKPGAAIRLCVGTVDSEKTIFEGFVVMLNIEIGEHHRSRMVVECRDALYPATLGRKNNVFEKQKDSDVISALLGKYGSISVEATGQEHPVLVQYGATDWDFALSRADANGMLVVSAEGKVAVKKPEVSAKPVLTVTYGEDLIDFKGGVSAMEQFAEVEGVSWDTAKQTIVTVAASKPGLNEQGSTEPSELSDGNKYLLQTDAPLGKEVLKTWADGLALRTGLARYRGSFSFNGNATVIPGCIVQLAGLGARFDGNAFIGAVEHTIRDQVWITRAEMGIDPRSITEEVDVTGPVAGGWLPGIGGLHVGKVKQLDKDPAKEKRILVEIPLMNGTKNDIWARWCSMYAGTDRGYFFVPEIGDEVLLGFIDDDPCCPVILGGLYSSKLPPPYEMEAENFRKGIVTKEGMKIVFDEEKKVITFETPGNNKIELSDDGKFIRLTDRNRNKMTMDDNGILLSSSGKITLKAEKDIVIDTVGNVNMTSNRDIVLEGGNVNAKARIGFTAKGNATAEISASGQTTIKGGIVMIN